MLDPTETVLFVAMTRDNAVWRLPFMKDGSVSKVGRFCSLFGTSGPDGLTVDRAGRLFVAHASLGHVFVFAPNGEVIARIKSCAGPSCTNVAIGGPNRDRLYITESVTGTVLVADIGVLDTSCMDGPLSARAFLASGERIGERSCIRPRDAASDRGP